jgi:hypothetical protein
MNPTSSRKPLLIYSLAAAGLVIALAAYYFISSSDSHKGKVPVSIYLLPTNAKITVDGQPATSGTLYLDPGEHTAVVTSDGYASQTNKQTLTEGQTQAAFDIALDPQSDAAKAWVKSHTDLYAKREGRAGNRAETDGQNFFKHNPIAQKLPVQNFIYSVGYSLDPSDASGQTIIIQIDAPIGYRNAAVNKIRELGYDPASFNINFEGFTNPFQP